MFVSLHCHLILTLNSLMQILEHTHTTYPLKPELQEKWKDLAGKEGKLLSSDLFLDKFSDLVEQAVKDMNASEKYEYK